MSDVWTGWDEGQDSRAVDEDWKDGVNRKIEPEMQNLESANTEYEMIRLASET